MLVILLILIFIRPFISSLTFPYLNAVYSGSLLLYLIPWIFLKSISLERIKSVKYPLILFCLALIISVVFSTNRFNSFKEIYKYITGLFLFMIAASLTNEDKMRIIHTIIFSGFIISILAIYQYFFGFQHVLDYISRQGASDSFALDYITRKRAFFPFVTPNTLGGYLAMVIPLTLINKNQIWLILPLCFSLLLTKSLGAFLSIFLALVIYFYLPRTFVKVRGLQGKFKKRKIVFLSVLLAIMGLVLVTRSVTQKQHLHPAFSMAMRLDYWRETLKIIKLYPLTGVGLGNFNLPQSRYAHNSYLQLWAEMGVLGIISILWLVISILKSCLKAIKNSSYKNQVAILITANTVFLIHNFLDFSFFLPEISLIWWAILGGLFSCHRLPLKQAPLSL